MTETTLTPVPPPAPAPGYTPSNSTIASVGGAALAGVTVAILGKYQIFLAAGYEAGLGGVFAAILGYFFNGGRR